MQIKENEIYIWEQGNAILGFCKVSINGIEEEFGAGYEIANKNGKKVKNGLAKNRAIRQVKIQFANVIDALKLHGKKILDNEGNIDPKEFLKVEEAIQRKKIKSGKTELEEEGLLTKLKDLKINMITEEESFKLNIGQI